jgi:hypothetical protein
MNVSFLLGHWPPGKPALCVGDDIQYRIIDIEYPRVYSDTILFMSHLIFRRLHSPFRSRQNPCLTSITFLAVAPCNTEFHPRRSAPAVAGMLPLSGEDKDAFLLIFFLLFFYWFSGGYIVLGQGCDSQGREGDGYCSRLYSSLK